MKKVMVFGTFDIFHKGHISFLKQAIVYGDYLIVVVARDKTVRAVKGAWSQNKEDNRLQTIKDSSLASEVVLGSQTNKYSAIKKYQPDVICLGYDQKFFIDNLREELKKIDLEKTKIIKLKPYKPGIYKSSKLKNKIIMRFEDIAEEINKNRSKEKALVSASFFKTGKGQYGEGDKFLGLMMPIQREIAKKFIALDFVEIKKLLRSEYHDFRMVGLLILTYKYEKADMGLRKKIYQFYLKNLKAVNNWDLVDLTVPNILGRYLWESGQDRGLLYELVKSKNLWKRRIAILATFYFLKNKVFKDTLKIAEILLLDKEDLIH
ncbi:MAG: DNA alkylation repair protein [Candidatus Moranbacteria bacterium]|jgi:cytidyltransferase-like protein|nr:DNA alkylation repair protein [Candidatus Moranbacteria bacterium]